VGTTIYVVAGPHNWDQTVFGVAFQYIFNVLCSYMVKPDLCFSDVWCPKYFSCHIFACMYLLLTGIVQLKITQLCALTI
jgi:hypothetical protein